MEHSAVVAPFYSLHCLVQSLWRVRKDLFRDAALTPVIISTHGAEVGLSIIFTGWGS